MAEGSDAMMRQLLEGIVSLQASSATQQAFNASLQKQLEDNTKEMKASIDKLEQGNREVFAKISKLEQETDRKLSKVAADLRAWAETKIDQKIADDHHSKRFCGAPSSSAPSSAPTIVPTGTPHAAAAQDDSGTILIGGFPRELPKPALTAHYNAIRNAVPHDMMEGAVLQAGHGKKAYGIKFPSRAAAIRFSSHTRDNPLVLCWTDSRTGMFAPGMWARAPKTVQENEVGKIFAAGYQLLLDRLTKSSVWTRDHKLQTDRKKGRIAVHTETDFWVLIVLEGEEREVNLHLPELAHFGVLPTEAETIREQLAQVVRARRPAAA